MTSYKIVDNELNNSNIRPGASKIMDWGKSKMTLLTMTADCITLMVVSDRLFGIYNLHLKAKEV